jgi:hypothetical protein
MDHTSESPTAELISQNADNVATIANFDTLTIAFPIYYTSIEPVSEVIAAPMLEVIAAPMAVSNPEIVALLTANLIAKLNNIMVMPASTKALKSNVRAELAKILPPVQMSIDDGKYYKWWFSIDFWHEDGYRIYLNLEIYDCKWTRNDPEYFSKIFINSDGSLCPKLDLTSNKLTMENKPLRNCYYGSQGNAHVDFDVEWF